MGGWAQDCALTSVVPVQVREEGVPGPGVEMAQEPDLGEAVRKAPPERPVQVEPAGVLCRVDRRHHQDKEEDLRCCREQSHRRAFGLDSLQPFLLAL